MISIITVVLNGEKTIKQTLESVCNQSFLPLEYIVVDGLSTDSTLKIVREYMVKYSFIKLISEKDDGMYDAMNKGIRSAKGELIGIINSDDWYEPNALEKMSEAFLKNGSGVYYGILRYISNEKEFYLERSNPDFLFQQMIPHPSTFVSADIYKEYGIFNLDYKISSDLELFIRYSLNEINFYPLDHIIANFRIGGASSTTSAGIESILIRKKYGLITNQQYYFKLLKFKIKSMINYKK
jgi:glycosyltransferase involved in cell wall biosynthesis